MKKIKNIVMENLKEQTIEQNLTGKDIFIGLNGSGKTSRIQAVLGAILGYIPGKDKTEKSTFELASGDSMTMGLQLEDGFSFERNFKKIVKTKKDGTIDVKITQDIDVVPNKGERTSTEKNQRIIDEVGDFPVMFDFNKFLEMTDTQRREFIFKLNKGGSLWTKEKVEKYLNTNLLHEDVEKVNPELYVAIKNAINAILVDIETEDIEKNIEIALSEAKENLSYWKKETDTLISTVQKLSDEKNKLTVTDRGLADDIKKQEQINEELIKFEKELSTVLEKNKVAAKVIEKIAILQKEIELIKAEKPIGKASDIEKLISTEEKKIKPVDSFAKEFEEIDKRIREQKDCIKKQLDALNKCKEEGTIKAADLNARKELLEKVKAQKGCCVIDGRIPCKNDFSDFIKSEEEFVKKLTEEVDILRTEWKTLDVKFKKDENNLEMLECQKEDTLIDQRKIQKLNEGARKNIIEHQKTLDKIRTFDEVKKTKLAEKEKELNELISRKAEIINIEALEKKISELREQGVVLKSEIKAKEQAKNIIIQLKKAQIEHTNAENNQIAYKYLVESLGVKGIQGEMVKDMLNPIKEAINANLLLMGCEYDFYFATNNEYGQEVFQFGWVNEKGRRVNFNALSTGQQLLLLIAMLVAFIEKANPNIRLLGLDNIENLDKKHLADVLKGLAKMEDKLDNIIMCGVTYPSELAEDLGFAIWDLSPGIEEESSIA